MKLNPSNLQAPARRNFLKQAASVGLVAGVGPWLASCGFTDDGASSGQKESRTHYYDLSKGDPTSDFYLMVGSTPHLLSLTDSAKLILARANDPDNEFEQIPDKLITHMLTMDLPADQPQMLEVREVYRGADYEPGSWSTYMMFYHVPAATAAMVGKALTACGKPPQSYKLASLAKMLESVVLAGLGVGQAQAAPYNYCTDPGNDDYQTYFDQAKAMVCHHPEVGSFDAATLSYVLQNHICSDASIQALAVSLYQQGPPSPTGGWATMEPIMDPNTQKQRRDSKGLLMYMRRHSPETLRLTGVVIKSVLQKIKNDPYLGANITDLSPTKENPEIKGKLWVVRNSTPTQLAPAAGAAPSSAAARAVRLAAQSASTGTTWTARDLSSGNGFSIHSITGTGRTVSFTTTNWYLRTLGLYVRYLDANGHGISFAPGEWGGRMDGQYDRFLGLIAPEVVVLGIPIKQDEQRFTLQIPDAASSIEIIAGGLGYGSVDRPATLALGIIMTSVFQMAMPMTFLVMGASTGYKAWQEATAIPTTLIKDFCFAMLAEAPRILALSGNVKTQNILNLIDPLIFPVLKKAASAGLFAAFTTAVAAGQAEAVAEDCIPFGIGLAIQAINALATLGAMIETSAEVCSSPWNYITQVSATHNLAVTIKHDPLHVAGFPTTAKFYKLTAQCDGASTYTSGPIAMPATTRTQDLSYTFLGLPEGGKVNVSVVFYDGSGWLSGAGETGPVANLGAPVSITIKEVLVPLTASTQYSHKQKIGLDAAGKHVWQQTSVAPLVQTSCDNIPGSLCNLVGITTSDPFGAVGYAWMASSAGVRNFATDTTGQLYQFANISITDTPESGYQFSGGGFSTPARLAYNRSSPTSQNFYIDSSTGASIVRRITLTGVDQPPVIDSPKSNKAVGRFNFASDAFLIHPTGKLISINTSLSKLEVLTPSAAPVADADAPLALSLSGRGTRDGLLAGPACMALSADGAIMVIEQQNNRIQAFDTGANPTKIFAKNSSATMALRENSAGATFMDLAVESVGYIYVLSAKANFYTLDIYDPQGAWLSATVGVNAGKLTVDLFRNLYTLNFETLKPIGNVTEPSISQWIPSAPTCTPAMVKDGTCVAT